MDQKRIVVLYGDSLFMDAVETSLDQFKELGLVRIYTSVTDVGKRLQSLGPDLVIFDINSSQIQFIIPFLKDQPDTPLLGLDITSSKITVICSQSHIVHTTSDLTWVIQKTTLGNAETNILPPDISLEELLT